MRCVLISELLLTLDVFDQISMNAYVLTIVMTMPIAITHKGLTCVNVKLVTKEMAQTAEVS